MKQNYVKCLPVMALALALSACGKNADENKHNTIDTASAITAAGIHTTFESDCGDVAAASADAAYDLSQCQLSPSQLALLQEVGPFKVEADGVRQTVRIKNAADQINGEGPIAQDGTYSVPLAIGTRFSELEGCPVKLEGLATGRVAFDENKKVVKVDVNTTFTFAHVDADTTALSAEFSLTEGVPGKMPAPGPIGKQPAPGPVGPGPGPVGPGPVGPGPVPAPVPAPASTDPAQPAPAPAQVPAPGPVVGPGPVPAPVPGPVPGVPGKMPAPGPTGKGGPGPVVSPSTGKQGPAMPGPAGKGTMPTTGKQGPAMPTTGKQGPAMPGPTGKGTQGNMPTGKGMQGQGKTGGGVIVPSQHLDSCVKFSPCGFSNNTSLSCKR